MSIPPPRQCIAEEIAIYYIGDKTQFAIEPCILPFGDHNTALVEVNPKKIKANKLSSIAGAIVAPSHG